MLRNHSISPVTVLCKQTEVRVGFPGLCPEHVIQLTWIAGMTSNITMQQYHHGQHNYVLAIPLWSIALCSNTKYMSIV